MSPEDPKIAAAGTELAGTTAREDIVAMFERRQEAYDNLEAAALAADYADDCSVESPTAGFHTGRLAVQEVLQRVFDGFPDLKVTAESLLIDGDRVAQVLKLEGTDIGGFLGLPPTGKSFHVPAVFLYDLRNGRIVRERRVYDHTGVLVQIGVLKAKPI